MVSPSRSCSRSFTNLLYMMMSVNPMEFSPLRRCQRPENRMVKHFAVPKANLALGNDFIHRLEFLHHLGSHCFGS